MWFARPAVTELLAIAYSEAALGHRLQPLTYAANTSTPAKVMIVRRIVATI
jgi:hypothetical protein